MKKAIVLVISALVLFASACKTPPEVVEAEPPSRPVAEPVTTPAPQPEVIAKPSLPAPARPAGSPVTLTETIRIPAGLAKPAPVAAAVAESDVERARAAVARARAADAAYYERDLYAAAVSDLDQGLAARASDPDRSRALLASTVDKADRAYRGSLGKGALDLESRWLAMDARLRAESADKYLAAAYRDTATQWERAVTLYTSGDAVAARAQAYAALKAQADLHERLLGRLAAVESLRREVDRALDDAEKEGAGQWATRELDETNRLYLLGVESHQAYRLDESEEYFGAARESARHATSVARQSRTQTVEQQRAEARRLMQQVMSEIEAASRMTVVSEDGTVILPQVWSGEDILKGLEGLEPPRADGSTLLLTEETAVLGDVYEESLLEQAKELWRKGLEANQAGDYVAAADYFREAQRYVVAYRSQAVKAVYTVRLIPELRDCLWRIAEYDFIFGDPFLWPKIWRRNRKLIQNPDLIYPGWLLIIPPEDAVSLDETGGSAP